MNQVVQADEAAEPLMSVSPSLFKEYIPKPPKQAPALKDLLPKKEQKQIECSVPAVSKISQTKGMAGNYMGEYVVSPNLSRQKVPKQVQAGAKKKKTTKHKKQVENAGSLDAVLQAGSAAKAGISMDRPTTATMVCIYFASLSLTQ